MSTIHRSRRAAFGLAAFLASALVTPLVVMAEEQALVVAPGAASWEETSGYGSVEASRAAVSALLAGDPSWDETSGYGAVERSRAAAAGLLAGLVTTVNQVPRDVRWAPAHTLEASRAARASDTSLACVRGAEYQETPSCSLLVAARDWDATSGYGGVEASRAAASAVPASDPVLDVPEGSASRAASVADQ